MPQLNVYAIFVFIYPISAKNQSLCNFSACLFVTNIFKGLKHLFFQLALLEMTDLKLTCTKQV